MTFHILCHAAVDLLREIHQRLFAAYDIRTRRTAVSCHTVQRHGNRLFCALYFELSCLCDTVLCRDFIAISAIAQCISQIASLLRLINFFTAENLHARRFPFTADVESHIVLLQCSHCDCHLAICCRNSKVSALKIILLCSRFIIVAALLQRIGVHAACCSLCLHQNAVRIRSLIYFEHCLCRTLYRDLRIRDLVRQGDGHRLIRLADDQGTGRVVLVRRGRFRGVAVLSCRQRSCECAVLLWLHLRCRSVLAERHLACTLRRYGDRMRCCVQRGQPSRHRIAVEQSTTDSKARKRQTV